MTEAISVSAETARRFILGRSGLWPGRRWAGKGGARSAMRAVEHLQLDPLVIVARSHDLMLHARVEGYTPEMFDELTHRDREFFDWGGWLAVRPMDELPYWRVLMRTHRSTGDFATQHPEALTEMRAALAAGERISSRDLEATGTETGKTYRGSKTRALALYHLWRTGEAMTWERRGFERVYAAAEAVAPGEFLREVDDREAELFIARKNVAAAGIGVLPVPSQFSYLFGKEITKEARAGIEGELIERGELTAVTVEGWKGRRFVMTADLPNLSAVAEGSAPQAWKAAKAGPVASFLSPLDPVTARGRAKELFGIEYVWEIYKRPADVKYGRYTMPILFGETLVGRIDLKTDRAKGTLVVNGLWFEAGAEAEEDTTFWDAFNAEVRRLMDLLGVENLDATAPGRKLGARLKPR